MAEETWTDDTDTLMGRLLVDSLRQQLAEVQRELTETRRGRIGDSEIMGRLMCEKEAAEQQIATLEKNLGDAQSDIAGEITERERQVATLTNLAMRRARDIAQLEHEVDVAAQQVATLTEECEQRQTNWQHLLDMKKIVDEKIVALTEALISAVTTCQSCDGSGSYYVGGEWKGHVICQRCGPWRAALAASRGDR